MSVKWENAYSIVYPTLLQQGTIVYTRHLLPESEFVEETGPIDASWIVPIYFHGREFYVVQGKVYDTRKSTSPGLWRMQSTRLLWEVTKQLEKSVRFWIDHISGIPLQKYLDISLKHLIPSGEELVK